MKKIHRFIGDFVLKQGSYTIADPEVIHQIWDVLKLRPGEQIVLCDGQLKESLATIQERGKSGILVTIENISTNMSESPDRAVLYCAILKKENFELVCQKATELGISEIVPVVTERTIKLNLRYDRLEKIIKEAAEQSGRGRLSTIKEAVSLEEAIVSAARFDQKVCFDVSGTQLAVGPASWALFIGPEGGWSDKELQQFKDAKFQLASLGPRMLRAETAAIVATHLATR